MKHLRETMFLLTIGWLSIFSLTAKGTIPEKGAIYAIYSKSKAHNTPVEDMPFYLEILADQAIDSSDSTPITLTVEDYTLTFVPEALRQTDKAVVKIKPQSNLSLWISTIHQCLLNNPLLISPQTNRTFLASPFDISCFFTLTSCMSGNGCNGSSETRTWLATLKIDAEPHIHAANTSSEDTENREVIMDTINTFLNDIMLNYTNYSIFYSLRELDLTEYTATYELDIPKSFKSVERLYLSHIGTPAVQALDIIEQPAHPSATAPSAQTIHNRTGRGCNQPLLHVIEESVQ